MGKSIPIIQQFGFDIHEEQRSIYPFSPVYRVDDYIVKTTQYPLEQAENLVNYTVHLRKNGIPVVTPVKLDSCNPKQIGDACYICYPFIHGADYKGTDEEIKQAGELLGRIHALASGDNVFHLETYHVFDFYHHEVDEHIERIGNMVHAYQMDIDIPALKQQFYQAVENQQELADAPLVWIETPHDYKANNLIYNGGPTLIDPDNAAWIPRIFDLALALLLFHNELATTPDRGFTPREWKVFLEGYVTHQSLTETEIRYWNKAVLHVFLDDVMWLLAEEEDWGNQAQRDLFASVTCLIFELERYHVSMAR